MFHRLVLSLPLAAALALAALMSANAQSAAPPPPPKPAPAGSTVQAVAYAPIPPGAHFETQLGDDSELNQETQNLVNKQLSDRGYTVDDQGGYVMVLQTDLVRGQQQDDLLGQYTDNDGNQVAARLFSSNQNSLLNPDRTIASADRIFRISISVYDRASGLYVWRASVTRENPELDTSTATNEMVPELLANLGRTLKPAQP